jgi:hypothetical protein
MIWDKLFWAWFVAMGFLVVVMLATELSLTNLALSLILIGTGFFKLSQEIRGEKRISRSIIEKLKQGK